MRAAVLALCVAVGASVGAAQTGPATRLPPRQDPAAPIEALRADLTASTQLPGVRRGTWGIVVHSIDRRERLFELNPQALLVPASTGKLVSAASAGDTVGWDFTFSTELHATGPIEDGVLRGDLVVVGHGDPSWSGAAGVDVSALATALAGRVRRIDGLVIADDDLVEEPRPALAWTWDDLGYPSGALFGALNVGENEMIVRVRPGDAEGQPTLLSADLAALDRPLVNRTTTGARGTVGRIWPEQRPGEPFLTIAGSLPARGAETRLSVSVGNPTLWFARRLRAALVAAGIEVTGEAFDVDDIRPRPELTAATLVHSHTSPPISALVRPMLKDSINLYGEALMRLNAAADGLPTNDAALDGLRKRLTAWGVAPDGVQVVDGSGLSRRSVVSADALTLILQRMHDPDGRSPFVTALPVAGVDGSLARRMKGTAAEGRVRAKTGTMSNIRTLAGYATTADGEQLAFAFLLNNFEGTGADANDALDRMAIRLASFSRAAP
jgi:D-alanyl-D-alanine carboxypeptidase/D-alanyl-D-alanine-endopeptidase (penicillin-binding protein 4)